MAKSIRSKWKRKCRAVKRVRYGEKELVRLKKTLGIDENNQDVEMRSSAATIVKVVPKRNMKLNVEKVQESNSTDANKRVYDPKTMRDQNGCYPVWMNQRRIRKNRKIKKNKKKKATKKKH